MFDLPNKQVGSHCRDALVVAHNPTQAITGSVAGHVQVSVSVALHAASAVHSRSCGSSTERDLRIDPQLRQHGRETG